MHLISGIHSKLVFSSIQVRCLEPDYKARRKKRAGVWLNALPVSSLGKLLDSESFRVAIALTVGADINFVFLILAAEARADGQ